MDIVVTAQRRDESLSKTPVAVQAVTAEGLQKAQITTENDLRSATPGLSVRAGQSDTQLNFSLRGQSQDPFSDTRAGVLPYFNEVPLGGQGISTALYDLQSVQVLKGPQGTLFGRSSTGGAVLYTTAKPTDELGGFGILSYGSRESLRVEGAVNLPIVQDMIALRLAGFYSESNGFQRNLYDNKRVGDRERMGGRATLLIKPAEGIRNTTVYDYFHADGQNTASVLSGLLPFTGTGAPFFPATFLYSGTATPTATITGQCTLQAIAQFPGACPPVNPAVSGFYNGYFSDPRRTNTGLSGVLDQQQANGPRVVNYNSMNLFRATVHTVVNTTELELGPDTTLKNIFGYQHSKADTAIDSDASPFGISVFDVPQRNLSRQITNELQISGTAIQDKLDYVAGVFYSDERRRFTARLSFFDLIFGGQSDSYYYTQSSKTIAGYAQGTYALNDAGLSVTAGLRYTSEEAGIVIDPTRDIGRGSFCAAPGFDCTQSETYKNLCWTLCLQNQISTDLLLYAVTRRSYKAGGFSGFLPPRVGTVEVGGNAYRAERTTDVELGAKYNGSLAGLPLRLNLALYKAWTHNGQRIAYGVVNGAPGSEVVNVPKQETYGAELDASLRPVDWLTVGGTINYTNSKYTDGNVLIFNDVAPGVQGLIPQQFDRVPDTPRTSGTIYADATIPVTGSLDVLLHGDLYFQASQFMTSQSLNFAGTTLGAYSLATFRVGVEDHDKRWSLTAILKNAFDKEHYIGGFAVGSIYQINNLTPGEPRTFLVTARVAF